MNMVSIFTKATRLVAGAGVGMIISNAVKATTPDDIKTYKKIAIAVGSFAIGSLVSAKVEEHIESEINAVVEGFKKAWNDSDEVLVVEPTDVQDDIATEEPNA